MPRIKDEDIERVKSATDVVALIAQRVVLKPKSGVYWGCCPFHGEKTPSFKVDPATGLWYCFGCHEHGNAIDFVMKTENLSFPEAVMSLAEQAHIEIEYEKGSARDRGFMSQIRNVCDETASYYHALLRGSHSELANKARDYLSKRGMGSEVAKEWQLGVAPGHGALVEHLASKGLSTDAMIKANVAVGSGSAVRDRFYDRVMFPIRDVTGRVIAFGGRVIGEGNPKYLNSSDTPLFKKSKNLYGIDRAKSFLVTEQTAIVVEGYTDVIALHQAGITNAVATLGTALTAEHIKLLGRFTRRIIYIFDGDEAGLRAADRAVEFIDETITPEASSHPIVLDVVVLPGGADPADIASSEGGAEKFKQLLSNAQPLIKFALDRRLSRWDLTRPEERQRALSDATAVLAPIASSVIATDYFEYIKDRLWSAGSRVTEEQVRAACRAATPRIHTIPESSDGAGLSKTPEEAVIPVFDLSRDANAEERLDQDIIALMVSDVPSRSLFAATELEQWLIVNPYQALYRKLITSQESPKAIITSLTGQFHGLEELMARSDRPTPDGAQRKQLVADYVRRAEELSLERTIVSLTFRLKHRSFDEGSTESELVAQIARAQARLMDIRIKRLS